MSVTQPLLAYNFRVDFFHVNLTDQERFALAHNLKNATVNHVAQTIELQIFNGEDLDLLNACYKLAQNRDFKMMIVTTPDSVRGAVFEFNISKVNDAKTVFDYSVADVALTHFVLEFDEIVISIQDFKKVQEEKEKLQKKYEKLQSEAKNAITVEDLLRKSQSKEVFNNAGVVPDPELDEMNENCDNDEEKTDKG